MAENKMVRLNNGVEIPQMFLGTWDIRTQEQADTSVKAAVSAGYRGIDAAACYENELVIRHGIEHCGVDRKELFVTSKLWNNAHGYDNALRTFDESEEKLGSIDMYLIHWPGPVPSFLETWKAFERLYEEKRVKVIGISNFMSVQLDILLHHCNIKPMINQIECHLWYTDYLLLQYCAVKNITVQAFSPLSSGTGLINDETLKKMAVKYGRTPAQVALHYLLQLGVYPVPKSSNPKRIAENIDIYGFEIEDEDMRTLAAMNQLVRTNKDPLRWFDPEYK